MDSRVFIIFNSNTLNVQFISIIIKNYDIHLIIRIVIYILLIDMEQMNLSRQTEMAICLDLYSFQK
jgi:hypothetical protein